MSLGESRRDNEWKIVNPAGMLRTFNQRLLDTRVNLNKAALTPTQLAAAKARDEAIVKSFASGVASGQAALLASSIVAPGGGGRLGTPVPEDGRASDILVAERATRMSCRNPGQISSTRLERRVRNQTGEGIAQLYVDDVTLQTPKITGVTFFGVNPRDPELLQKAKQKLTGIGCSSLLPAFT